MFVYIVSSLDTRVDWIYRWCKVAACGKLIFLLPTCGVGGSTLERESMDGVSFPCRTMESPSPIPIKLIYVTFKKNTAKPLIHAATGWAAPFLLSPHLVLTFLVSSPDLSLFVCICVNVCTFSRVWPLGTTAVRFPKSLQKALFSLRDLGEPAVLKASQDCWEECCGAGKGYKPNSFANIDVFRCS